MYADQRVRGSVSPPRPARSGVWQPFGLQNGCKGDQAEALMAARCSDAPLLLRSNGHAEYAPAFGSRPVTPTLHARQHRPPRHLRRVAGLLVQPEDPPRDGVDSSDGVARAASAVQIEVPRSTREPPGAGMPPGLATTTPAVLGIHATSPAKRPRAERRGTRTPNR
jgi:hypothetical protein